MIINSANIYTILNKKKLFRIILNKNYLYLLKISNELLYAVLKRNGFISELILLSSIKETNFSVGIFPINLSVAIGHPPKPFIAPSKRLHPAS